MFPEPLRKALFKGSQNQVSQSFKTFTEYSPVFSSWEGSLYEQAQTRAIIERIASACSKAKPEFVTPEGSGGSVPRIQRLFTSNPNDMDTWPKFIRRVMTILLTDTTAFVVPGYDRDGNIISLWALKPTYTEIVEYQGEPYIRFRLPVGEVAAYPFYDVAILTRFQLESDVFGGGNTPLTPTLRLMDAQRQAEEIALKTGADIRFVGKMTTNMQDAAMERYRDRFAEKNFGPGNKSRLVLYDNRMDDLKQIEQQHYTVDPDEMARIDKALYSYFGINEKILTNSYNEAEWAAFYEGCVEHLLIELGSALSKMLLTPTQLRKGNHIMFSSSYLEYSTSDTKIKVVKELSSIGMLTFDEGRDIFQLPHIPGGKVRPVRGEIYLLDDKNNIVAESGGRTDGHADHSLWHDDLSDLDEPDSDFEPDDETRAVARALARMIDKRLAEVA
jgi:hypothetical protein